MSSLLCTLHVCVCEVWRLWWLSFCLWLLALFIACFQPSDTRAIHNFYVKLMSLQIHCRSLRSLFVLVQSLIKKKCKGIRSIGKLQSDTTYNICIAERFFYIACLNNNMIQPVYRPSSGCTLSYKASYTIYNVFVFVNEISCTSIKFAFKII